MRFKNWDKDEFHQAFPQFCPEYTFYILRHCINIVFILQKNHINPLTIIFELNNKII
jgi:hypothetical protein